MKSTTYVQEVSNLRGPVAHSSKCDLVVRFILAKQKKVSRPPRRQSGIRTHQRSRTRFNARLRYLSPNGEGEGRGKGTRNGFGNGIRDRAFSGSEHKFSEPVARPCGCFASLRSEIVIRPQKPGPRHALANATNSIAAHARNPWATSQKHPQAQS